MIPTNISKLISHSECQTDSLFIRSCPALNGGLMKRGGYRAWWQAIDLQSITKIPPGENDLGKSNKMLIFSLLPPRQKPSRTHNMLQLSGNYCYLWATIGTKLNMMMNTHLSSVNTEVSEYEAPLCTEVVVETQGMICGSSDATEPVTEIDGLW